MTLSERTNSFPTWLFLVAVLAGGVLSVAVFGNDLGIQIGVTVGLVSGWTLRAFQ